MKLHHRDFVSVFRFYKDNGVSKTLRKISWALGTRGLRVTDLTKNGLVQYRGSDPTNAPSWNAGDLLYRSQKIRDKSPRSEIRNFAFYLPQFHEIEENNNWWGSGFTDWTNVKKATQQFFGHYQPHEPLNNHYYDLSNVDEMQKQANLARIFGIDAFVVYYYWFDGKKLLNKPLENLTGNPEVTFPYMICWANENWSRRWDGKSNEILIEQQYRENFAKDFITDASVHFSSRNYQTIDGRPILLVYRPKDIPNIVKVTSEWRNYVKELGYKDLYLIAVQSFSQINAHDYGFDACVNFAPNNMGLVPKTMADSEINAYEYDDLVSFNQIKSSRYPVFSCVTPSWDNSARRGANGTLLLGNSPTKFRNWLYRESRNTYHKFCNPEEKIVFINAWNEWAEGSHLEPDKKYGYQWLHAVADCKEEVYWENFSPLALESKMRESQERIFPSDHVKNRFTNKVILVVHDLHRNGAQINGLNMLREFIGKGVSVQVIALSGGPLISDFETFSSQSLIIVDELPLIEFDNQLKSLSIKGFSSAIINSVASGEIADKLNENGIEVISLVHELPETIEDYSLIEAATKIANYSKCVVFPSKYVENEFSRVSLVKKTSLVLPQGLYNMKSQRLWPDWKTANLINELNWTNNSPIVAGIGYGDVRKGFDIFCGVAKAAKHLNFLWVGAVSTSETIIKEALESAPENLKVVQFQDDISLFLQISDLVLITSRKDPFPSTALESLGRGIPFLAIKDCTGLEELMRTLDLPIIPSPDNNLIIKAIEEVFSSESSEKRNYRSHYIRTEMNYREYCSRLLHLNSIPHSTVSAVIPNFNYGQYIVERLNQIENQTYTVDQIILCDDVSTDNSFDRACDFLHLSRARVIIEQNSTNSGSPFLNWPKAIQKCDGDFVWIAEADDVTSLDFLYFMIPYDDDTVGMAYCNSSQIDEKGNEFAEDFSEYLERITRRNFRLSYYADGKKEISECLAIQNTIPNISSVVFRTKILKKRLAGLPTFLHDLQTAADWYLYIEILSDSSIYYSCKSLNSQRRHKSSVIGGASADLMISEIRRVQEHVSSKYSLTQDVIDAGQQFVDSLRSKRY